MTKERPGDGELVDLSSFENIRDWPTISVKVSVGMKTHLIEALHEEGWTLSVSEYIRVVMANHIAEVLGISPVEVLRDKPKRGAAGRKYMRVQ